MLLTYVCIIRTVDLSGITSQIATAITTNGTGQAINQQKMGIHQKLYPLIGQHWFPKPKSCKWFQLL